MFGMVQKAKNPTGEETSVGFFAYEFFNYCARNGSSLVFLDGKTQASI